MSEPTIGEQELALLRYVADRPDATVGEVAESFGQERGLARSTGRVIWFFFGSIVTSSREL